MRIKNQLINLRVCSNLMDLRRKIWLRSFWGKFNVSLIRIVFRDLFDRTDLLSVGINILCLFESIQFRSKQCINHDWMLLLCLICLIDVLLQSIVLRFSCSFWILLCFWTWSSLQYCSWRTSHLN